MSNKGQPILSAFEIGAPSIANTIFHHVGNTVTVISKPADLSAATVLYLHVEDGNCRIKMGDWGGGEEEGEDIPGEEQALAYVAPADVTEDEDGYGSVHFTATDQPLIITAPNKFTVAGDADLVLTYWWGSNARYVPAS